MHLFAGRLHILGYRPRWRERLPSMPEGLLQDDPVLVVDSNHPLPRGDGGHARTARSISERRRATRPASGASTSSKRTVAAGHACILCRLGDGARAILVEVVAVFLEGAETISWPRAGMTTSRQLEVHGPAHIALAAWSARECNGTRDVDTKKKGRVGFEGAEWPYGSGRATSIHRVHAGVHDGNRISVCATVGRLGAR